MGKINKNNIFFFNHNRIKKKKQIIKLINYFNIMLNAKLP